MRILSLVLIALSFVLSGCGWTPWGDSIRNAVSSYGAQAYDEGLANSQFFICKAASVGSVMRLYGKSQATADAWRTLCGGQDGVNLIGPSTKSP